MILRTNISYDSCDASTISTVRAKNTHQHFLQFADHPQRTATVAMPPPCRPLTEECSSAEENSSASGLQRPITLEYQISPSAIPFDTPVTGMLLWGLVIFFKVTKGNNLLDTAYCNFERAFGRGGCFPILPMTHDNSYSALSLFRDFPKNLY